MKMSKLDAELRFVISSLRNDAEGYYCHSRFWMHDYLQDVYGTYFRWKERKNVKRNVRQLVKAFHLKLQRDTHPFRALLAATSPVKNPKVLSRWTRALEYAEHDGVSPKLLLKEFRQYGGISGCARMMSRACPKRKLDEDEDDDRDDDVRFARVLKAINNPNYPYVAPVDK